MISFSTPKHHWNYFLAIEKDLENISRYIEFASPNLNVYSIELTHILLSASSEIDVVMKQICELVYPGQTYDNINKYRDCIKNHLSTFVNEEIVISRFGLTFKPWINWNGVDNPDWWKSYNKVKHQRNIHFNEANLQNTLNAVGALLLAVVYYYKLAFSKEANQNVSFKDTTLELRPEASIMKINANYYNFSLITE